MKKLYGSSTASKSKRARLRRCMAAIVQPWPVTPMKRASPCSRASSVASSAPPGPKAWSQSSGCPSECSWIRSTWSTRSRSSERWMSSRASRAVRIPVFVARKKSFRCRAIHSNSSSVRSASAWLARARAAPPNRVTVLRWPVRPNGRRSSMPPLSNARHPVQPRAVVPQDLRFRLIAHALAPDELLDGGREEAVGVRVIGGHDDVVVADRVHHMPQDLLVGVRRDVALPEELLARECGYLHLRAGAELLPGLVEAPEPPGEPAARALEEGAAQPGVTFEHAPGGEAREGEHELHRIAPGAADDASVRVVEETVGDVVAQRGLPGRVEPDGHAELLDRVPERLELWFVDVVAT